MTVALPPEQLESEFDARLKKLCRQVKLPGFRPGKVPPKVVEAQYGRELLEEARTELIQRSFYEAASSQGLQPAAGPTIAPKPAVRGKALEYTAEFEVYPEVARRDLSGITVEKPVCAIGNTDVDRTMEVMQRQRVSWVESGTSAQQGDRVMIDFTGRLNGEVFEGGEAKDFGLVLGSGQLIPGFEEGLVGAEAGSTRRLPIRFPENYQAQQLAGKDAEFEVLVKQVQKPVLPDLDAAFARSLGVADGDVATLRAEIAAGLEKEAAKRIRGLMKERVFKAMLDANAGEVPGVLVEQEAHQLMEAARETLGRQGIARDRLPQDPAAFRERARSRVALGIILTAVIKERKLRVHPAAVRERVEELAASYERPDEFVQWHYGRPERLRDIEAAVLEDQVVAALLETADVREQLTAFVDLPAGN